MSRSRAIKLLWPACVLAAAACTDGSGPTASGRAVPLDIRPSFQVDPSLFPAEPVDRIRLTARDASTSENVGSADLEVSPTAEQWALSLGITLGEAPSRIVMVDVELLAGDVVQWSGRLGPITVLAGATSPVQSVDIHRGSLADLDVIGLGLVDPATSIEVGSTVMLVANPTLMSGSTVVPTVYWASTSTSVATVTSQGLVATVTGVGAGTTQIVAVAGSVSVELDVEVTEVAPPGTKTWVGGDAGGATDWAAANNWQPAGVPSANESVYVPYTLSQPVLSSSEAVASLFVDVSAQVNLGGFTLSVSGDVALDGFVTNGSLDVVGQGAELRRTVDHLRITAPRAASGVLYVFGDLTVEAPLSIGPSGVDVLGGLGVGTSLGALVMQSSSAAVVVAGNVAFDGASHDGLLTAGQLVVEGDFTVGSTFVDDAFSPTGVLVYLQGGNAQTVSFSSPGLGTQAFYDLYVSKTGGSVTLGSDMGVANIFYAYDATLAQGLRALPTLEVYGGLNV